jgi:hypothetical protein
MLPSQKKFATNFSRTVLAVAAAGVVTFHACGKDKKNGGSIGAPRAYPPTAEVTPDQLVQSSGTGSSVKTGSKVSLAARPGSTGKTVRGRLTAPVEPSTDQEKAAMMDTVKSRLFSPGPTNLLSLVKGVDRRMADYDSRVGGMDSAPSCLSSTPVDVSSTFSVPAATGTTTFPLFGQCQETLGSGMTLMFGKKDNDWYLVDGANKEPDGSDSCVMTMAKISGTADADRVVDAYMAISYQGKTDNFTGSTTLMHFKADVAAGTLELTAGGIGIGANQMHVKSNANFLYVQTQDRSNSNSAALYHSCFNASDLSLTAIADCSSLQGSLELVSLGTKTGGSYSGGGQTMTVPATDANNVDLRTVVPDYCGKLSTAFAGIPAFQ